MDILKIALVMAAGLGSTWVARATTDALFGRPQGQYLAQTGGQQPDAKTPDAPPSDEPKPVQKPDEQKAGDTTPGGPQGAPPAVPEMSREEMEAELKRAQAEIAGKPGAGDTEEFRPTKPLPADLPIALPSDI